MSGQRAAFQTVEQEDVIPRGCQSWQICLGISLSVLPQWVSPLHCYISLLYLSILCIHSFHSRIHTYTKTMRISRPFYFLSLCIYTVFILVFPTMHLWDCKGPAISRLILTHIALSAPLELENIKALLDLYFVQQF